MSIDYTTFLASKHVTAAPSGFEVAADAINPKLHPFQRDAVRWALHLGKAALFEERGLGKTLQEFEWARWITEHTGGRVLILAPLAVAFQHLDEAVKWGYDLKYVETQADVGDATLVVTNYERLAHLDPTVFEGVILDESSILKAFNGKTKLALVDAFRRTPYKLAASATPAPNDHLELGNHAEFLDVMPSNEMIARWFINNSKKAGDYRLKKHAEKDFWRWLTSWGLCLSHPRDLGAAYDVPGYDLPELRTHMHWVDTSNATRERTYSEGKLLPDGNPSSTELFKVKGENLSGRIAIAQSITSALNPDDNAIYWCDTNDEADALQAAFPDAVEVRGSHTAKVKQERLRAFTFGETKRIITKADIAGMGLNWFHCGVQVFNGLTYSFEKFYQAVGRSHRYGRTTPVDIHIIAAETEAGVIETLWRKKADFAEMQSAMNEAVHEHGLFRDGNSNALKSATGTHPMILPLWLKERKTV